MSDIKLITLTNYVRPPLMEDKSRDWVMNGRLNQYYNYIISRNNGSPTNASINESYTTLIYGKGLRTSSGALGAEGWGRLQTILRPRELRKMVRDFQVFGEFSFEIIESKGGELHSLTHVPKEMLIPAIANEKNEIEKYWFSKNWQKYTELDYTPISFPAFGAQKGNSMFVARPYTVGNEYFGSPDYSSALVFAEIEEELSNMYISSIKNGLSAGYIINIPNGTNYTPEEKEEFERQVKLKLVSSSNASNFIISFNDQEVAIDVTPFPVNSSVHKQWSELTEQAKTQLMTAHRVISPSLVGLSSASGFSSVADEMDMSERQTIKRVIKPKQDFVIESLEEVLVHYGINLDLYFAPLTEEEVQQEEREIVVSEDNGVETTDVVGGDAETLKAQAALRGSVGGVNGVLGIQASVSAGTTDVESAVTILVEIYGFTRSVSEALLGKPQETAELSSHVCMSDGAPEELADSLIELGETLDASEWTMLSSTEVDYETDDDIYKTEFAVSIGRANPNAKSSQDNEDIAIRYRYVGNPNPQRAFCKKMMRANRLYRKEDILKMGTRVVNEGFGAKGTNDAPYSIWLYKGGGLRSKNFPQGTCRHAWNREIYLKRADGKGKVESSEKISTSEARRKGYKVPTNENIVSIKPHNA